MSNTKIIWLLVNVLILAYGIYLRNLNPDGTLIFLYLMYFVTFPMGYVVPLIFICISECFGISIYDQKHLLFSDITVPWVSFIFIGYLQWFVVFPKIISFLKKRKK